MYEDQQIIKYPPGEMLRTRYYKDGKISFFTTEKPSTGYFFLYEFIDGKFMKIGKSPSPLELESKFKVCERIGCK